MKARRWVLSGIDRWSLLPGAALPTMSCRFQELRLDPSLSANVIAFEVVFAAADCRCSASFVTAIVTLRWCMAGRNQCYRVQSAFHQCGLGVLYDPGQLFAFLMLYFSFDRSIL